MDNKQGSLLIEEVNSIECKNDNQREHYACRVSSEARIPTKYRNIEEVELKGIQKKKMDTLTINNDRQKYEFGEPVECTVEFGDSSNRIICE